ncbi:MAG: hypothetical protein IKY97_03015 [Mailhella sp.]|nr:hypothetical protein [Mailhella sp.]
MNATRRNNLRKLSSLIAEARTILEETTEAERAALDNTPEALQQTERFERDDENCSQLEDAVTALEDLDSLLDDILDNA